MAVPVSVVLVLALATAGAVNTCLAESATFHWRGATASFQDPDKYEKDGGFGGRGERKGG